MQDFAGKNVLVTGAARGIGFTIAQRFAQRGARVCLADVDYEGLEEKAASISADARAVFLDLLDTSSLESVVEKATGAIGEIDVLVNNAGVSKYGDWDALTTNDYDLMMGINVQGLIFLTQAVARRMVKNGSGGAIVNMVSIAARRGDSTNVIYSMSKSAVISLTQSAAGFYGPNGIRVNAVAPGYTQTPALDELFMHHEKLTGQNRERQEEDVLPRIQLRRIGTTDDQADAVLFLASPESAYITGQTINVDGGIYFH